MSRRAFDQTIEFIRRVDRASNPEEICSHLVGVTRQFGAEYILAGTIPSADASPQQQVSGIVLDHWPSEWTRRYFTHGYISRDPAIRGVATRTAPFLWSELEPVYRDSPSAWRIMKEAGDFKLKTGLTIPLATLEGNVVGFSFAGEALEVSAEERGMLILLATYALGRCILLRDAGPSRAVSLTPREREALQWAAEGKSEWEIGEIMGISEHGVDKHMRAARLKLGTTSRTHAVAEAIRQGLIG